MTAILLSLFAAAVLATASQRPSELEQRTDPVGRIEDAAHTPGR